MTARAPSGGRYLGDDIQCMIVWYQVMRALHCDSTLAGLAVEAAAFGNVDDLVMILADQTARCWQIKASVDAKKPMTERWLFALVGGLSLLQRLHASWKELRLHHSAPPEIILATTNAIDRNDPVLGLRATTDARIVDVFRDADGSLADRRQAWADHLGCDESELMEFLECLKIYHGQSQEEWREKIQVAAEAAGIRGDDPAIALGVQQVREWVKGARRTFTRQQLSGIVDDLGLRAPPRTALVVVHCLEPHPPPRAAQIEFDWTGLMYGDGPDTRRTFADAELANERIAADLADARRRLRAQGITDVEVDGSMRLPLSFAVGTGFLSSAGFTLSARARAGIWTSKARPDARHDLELILPDDMVERAPDRAWAVSVSLATDIGPYVDRYLTADGLDAVHIKARLPEPGREAIRGLGHGLAINFRLREELRTLDAAYGPREILLFLAMPAAAALLLGNAWDCMPPTTAFWHLGRPGRYAPGPRVRTT